MQLKKLFDAQKELSNRIMEEHPELKGKDNLPWKILAFQVEVSELANEWRGFKMWSHDKKPRVFKRVPCPSCLEKGYERGKPPIDDVKGVHGLGNHWYYCPTCKGFLVVDKNPLLEEYVDCLHFALDIGLEMKYEKLIKTINPVKNDNIINQFIFINTKAGTLLTYRALSNYIHILQNLIGLGEMLGFTWEEIEAAYFEKNKINHDRQNQGY